MFPIANSDLPSQFHPAEMIVRQLSLATMISHPPEPSPFESVPTNDGLPRALPEGSADSSPATTQPELLGAALEGQPSSGVIPDKRAELPAQAAPEQLLAAEPAASIDREARLAAELRTAREQAQTAAKLVLELNDRLGAARKREQLFQQAIATAQSALQRTNEALAQEQAALHVQQAAKLEAEAGIQRLTLQLETAYTEFRRLSEELNDQRRSAAAASNQRDDRLTGQTRQLLADKEALQQQMVTLSEVLRASHQAHMEAEARLEEQSQEMADLHQRLQEFQRQNLLAQNTLQALRAIQQADRSELQMVRQQYQALEQQTADDRRQWSALQQTRAEEMSGLQAASDAARRQLNEAENAVRLGQDKTDANAAQNESLAQSLHAAEQALAAGESAHQSAQSESETQLDELERVKQQISDRDSLIAELQARIQRNGDGLRSVQADNSAGPDAAADTTESALTPPVIAEMPTSETASSPRPAQAMEGSSLPNAGGTDPCPHLGLNTDRDTRHGFTSAKNRCHARMTSLEVTFAQQGTYCLQAAHTQCPIFTGEVRSPKVPIDTDAEAAQRARRKGPPRKRWLKSG